MENIMLQVRDYAKARGIKPQSVLNYACNFGHGTWAKWEAGATCSVSTVEKIQQYIRENPPK